MRAWLGIILTGLVSGILLGSTMYIVIFIAPHNSQIAIVPVKQFSVVTSVAPVSDCGETTSRLHIREKPTTSSASIDVLPLGAVVCFKEYDTDGVMQWGLIEETYYVSGWVALPYINRFKSKPYEFLTLPSFSTDPGCIYNQQTFEVVSPQTFVVNRGLVSYSTVQIAAFDAIVAKYMNKPLLPAVVWFIPVDERTAVERYFGHQEAYASDYNGWAGKVDRYFGWDGCDLSRFHGEGTSLIFMKDITDDAWAFGGYFHERAHTLGARHGDRAKAWPASANISIDVGVTGVDDAYWWSDVAYHAKLGSCGDFSVTTLDYAVCEEILLVK